MTVPITGSVKDVTGVEDNETPWSFASVIRFAEDGSVITEKPREVRAVSGNLKVNLVPGYAIVTYGKQVWQVTVPETATTLKALIEAGVAFPPDTSQALLDAAVGQYVEANREQFRTRAVPITTGPDAGKLQWYDENGAEVGGPVEAWTVTSVTADGISDAQETGKEVVRSATQSDARAAIGAAAPSDSPRVFFTAAERADGTLPTVGTLDSGHPYEVTHSGATGFDIVSGALETDAALGYLNFGPLPGPVQEFWQELSWSDDSQAEDELAVLIVADGPFATNYPEGGTDGNYANAGAHVLLFRDRWSYQKRDYNGPPVSTQVHYYPEPLAYGVKHRIGLIWDGETPTMVDPDGTQTTVPADPDYATWWGPYACMQLLGDTAGTNKVRCHAFTVNSEVTLNSSRFATGGSASGYGTTVTAGGTTTLNAASKRVQVFTGSANHTVLLPSTDLDAGEEFTIVNLSSGSVTVQSSNTNAIQILSGNRTGSFLSREDAPTTAGQWHTMALTGTAVSGSNTSVLRDSNANVFADNFITGYDTTATAAGTTTLTVNSRRVQVFTGTTTQDVLLPSASVVAGQDYTIINLSTGLVTVKSSGGSTLMTMRGTRSATFLAVVDTPSGAGDWQAMALTSTSSSSGPNTAVARDNDSTINANSFVAAKTTTATFAGTLVLGVNYPEVQVFTGSTTHTVRLPTTSVTAGRQWKIINQSTGDVTVQSSAAEVIATVTAGTMQIFVAMADAPTTAAQWRAI